MQASPPPESNLRWLAVSVIVLSSALNYLDRMVLAALAPTIQSQFHLTGRDYGFILSAFSLVYAFSSPLVGLMIDRVGLMWGTALVVAFWSMAGTATGLVSSFGTLLLCRAALGFAEAGGVPATGKAFATFLASKDRAFGTGLNQVGLTIGSSAAPLLTAWCVQHYDWRAAFVISGLLGFLWIPLWLTTVRRVPPAETAPVQRPGGALGIIRDRRFAALIAANMLSMTVYSLWTNWTTVFLVGRHGLSPGEANRFYAWVPPLFATLGGLFGGWIAHRLIRDGHEVLPARLRTSVLGGLLVLPMALAPLAPTPGLATAAICVGLFAVTCQSVNYYAVPLDMFGAGHAAFAVSALTGAFGLMQAFLSPLIGDWSERYGWEPVCYLVALLPLASTAMLYIAIRQPKSTAIPILIRAGSAGDLDEVQEIEAQTSESARWEPETYLGFDLTVAKIRSEVAGFMVTRSTAAREREVLNIAVAPRHRRKGVASRLIRSIDASEVFLEVRESNEGAILLYRKLGFEEIGRRPGYYDNPMEAAIVMRLVLVRSPANK